VRHRGATALPSPEEGGGLDGAAGALPCLILALLTSRQPLTFITVPNVPAEPEGAFAALICLALPSLEMMAITPGAG
jgi:hypothetical protein